MAVILQKKAAFLSNPSSLYSTAAVLYRWIWFEKKKGCDLEIQCSTDDKNHFWGGGVGVGGVE